VGAGAPARMGPQQSAKDLPEPQGQVSGEGLAWAVSGDEVGMERMIAGEEGGDGKSGVRGGRRMRYDTK